MALLSVRLIGCEVNLYKTFRLCDIILCERSREHHAVEKKLIFTIIQHVLVNAIIFVISLESIISWKCDKLVTFS